MQQGLMKHDDVLKIISKFQEHTDLIVDYDKEAGTLEVFNKNGNIVVRAIQKGYNQPWIILRVAK